MNLWISMFLIKELDIFSNSSGRSRVTNSSSQVKEGKVESMHDARNLTNTLLYSMVNYINLKFEVILIIGYDLNHF